MAAFSNDLGFNPFDKGNDGYGQLFATEGMGRKFIDSFNQLDIFCYNGNPSKKISSMKHTNDLIEVYHANRDSGVDAYFYINGGRKQYAINRINACFCDMDAGRDNEGKYFKPSVVMEHKEGFLKKINEFPVPPSWVVDTRNGYQCYWMLDMNDHHIDRITWKGLQKKLANHFGGDPLAIKINQIFRLPYTWWRKGWEGKAPYFTSILNGSTGAPVRFNDLKNALEGTSANINYKDISKSSNAWFDAWKTVSDQASANGTPVEHMNLEDKRKLHRKVADIVFEATNNLNQKTPIDDVDEASRLHKSDYQKSSDSESIAGHAKSVLKTLSLGLMNWDYAKPTEPKPAPNISDSDSKINYSHKEAAVSTHDESEHFVPMPYEIHKKSLSNSDLNADAQNAFLLKKTVEFLNQVSTPLWFSKNHFLSRAARELADEISDKFCVG